MPKGTLKKPKATTPFEIRPVEEQNSPDFARYMKELDNIFRNNGVEEVLGAAGFVCYLAFDRSAKDPSITRHHWFRGLKGPRDGLDRSVTEKLLARHYSGRMWLTHLKGHRHDYLFYSRIGIEETLDLFEVARVMVS